MAFGGNKSMSILFEHATVYDGLGSKPQETSVWVEAGKIAGLGTFEDAKLPRVDCRGKILAPSFLDIHAHSDYLPLVDPPGLSKVLDGVGMEVSGNCGMSSFPLPSPAGHEELGEIPGFSPDWTGFESYRQTLEAGGMGLDRAFLVGHGTLRAWAMGLEDRPATPSEIDAMQAKLREALEEGAAGFSTGLIYAPGCFAKAAEILALVEVVAEFDRLYASHIRGEGDTLLEAIDEVLGVARATGVRTQISHLKASKPKNWEKLPRAIEAIEAARSEGLDVMADRYPYTATSTNLDVLLPHAALAGGPPEVARRCTRGSPEYKDLRRHLQGRYDEAYLSRVQIATAGLELEGIALGRRVPEVAAELGLSCQEAVLELLRDSGGSAQAVFHVLSEENLDQVLALDWVMLGSDGSARCVGGPSGKGHPHPRAFGSFARVLSHFVRARGHLGWAEALRKMTSQPADRLGLSDRGRIEVGASADLVLFDPDSIQDQASFEDPLRYSKGIEALYLRGEPVVEAGAPTGRLLGKVVRCMS